MKITDIRVNGIREPLGFCLPHVSISWKVADTASKQPARERLCVAADPDFAQILFEKEGEKLRSIGEKVTISLQPRTRYYVRVEVRGDAGDLKPARWTSPGRENGSERRRRMRSIRFSSMTFC